MTPVTSWLELQQLPFQSLQLMQAGRLHCLTVKPSSVINSTDNKRPKTGIQTVPQQLQRSHWY